MIEDKIKGLLQGQNKKVKDLCAYIDLTDAGLRKIYQRDSCELSTLLKIANFFSVSPSYFLDCAETTNINNSGDGIAVGGNATDVNSAKAIIAMIAEVSAQRKMTEKALAQIERLVGVVSDLN